MFRTQHSRKMIESLISLSKHRQVEGVANMAHPSTPPSRFSGRGHGCGAEDTRKFSLETDQKNTVRFRFQP